VPKLFKTVMSFSVYRKAKHYKSCTNCKN